MEWNTKWDWENLDMFNSDMGNNSSTKSSLSASTESSFKDINIKESNYFLDTYSKKEVSVCTGEPSIGLKLGKRTYFENNYGKNDSKTSPRLSIPASFVSTGKKVKSSRQSMPMSRCQVEGCNLDLSSAKEYHRKHRVCERHSKCPKVIVAGLERRFCQQCSRFHGISEFDEEKRSCRRRLSDHNARRRKPQHEPIQFNSTNPYSSFCYGTEFGDVMSHSTGLQLSDVLNMPTLARTRLVPSKSPKAETFDQGFKESLSSNVDAADLQRALSLLSNNSWCSYDPDSIHMHLTSPSMPQHAVPEGSPLSSQEYWKANQQPHIRALAAKNANNQFQEFNIFKSPYENSFFCHPSG